MRTIEGYVFVPQIGDSNHRQILGPYSEFDEEDKRSNKISLNNLATFDSEMNARGAARNFQVKRGRSPRIDFAKIRLRIPHEQSEMVYFEKENSLIVLSNYLQTAAGPKEIGLFGPPLEGNPVVCPVRYSPLEENGLRSYEDEMLDNWTPYQIATTVSKEIEKDLGQSTTLAQFKIEFL